MALELPKLNHDYAIVTLVGKRDDVDEGVSCRVYVRFYWLERACCLRLIGAQQRCLQSRLLKTGHWNNNNKFRQ